MINGQIDQLCRDWLRQNYSEEVASEYTSHSLLISVFNAADLNNALEEFMQVMYLSFGPGQSPESTDFYEARERLRLSDDRTPVPYVFIRAFVETWS